MKQRGAQNQWLALLSLALALLMTPGCRTGGGEDWSITQRLWAGDAFVDFKSAAADPHLQLFADEAHSDVMVLYDEAGENNSRIRRRAFFVNRNLDRIADQRKPRFVRESASRGLKPIPVLAAGFRDQLPSSGLAVLMTGERDEFILYADGRELTMATLPSYLSNGAPGKALVTPLAVAGDAVLVATVVGLIAAWAYAQSGGPAY